MRISVVVIAKNAEGTISGCLDSIMNQTSLPYEVVVVDGASTDQTREIALRYDCRVIVSTGKDTYGLARNRGVAESKGDVIAFLDADDRADPNWLEEIASAFREEKIQIATARRQYTYAANWFTEIKWRNHQSVHPPSQSIGAVDWDNFRTISGVVRKAAIEAIGGFDEDMFFGTEDKDLAFRLWRRGNQIILINRAIIFHRPASTVGEWLKDSFYRHGIGHGVMRRKYGVYRPPLLTPAVSVGFLTLIAYFASGRELIGVLTTVAGSALTLIYKSFMLYRDTWNMQASIAYTSLEILARNLELAGFLIGYLVPKGTIRKIWRR